MNAAFSIFSPQQWHVLQALNHYRLLTVDQMVRLGLSKNPKSLRDKTLFALRHQKLIRSEKIGSFLPDVHHLTKQGREVLVQIEGDAAPLPANKRTPFSACFAPHRFAQIDFQIGINQWAEKRGDADVLLELQDFIAELGAHKRHPQASTELTSSGLLSPVISDGAFVVGLHSGKVAMYLVEIHRSSHSKMVIDQLVRYFDIIKSGAAQQKYGFKVNPIVCSVHHQASVLNSVKHRLVQHSEFIQFKNNIVFHDLATLNTQFETGWHFADDRAANPFPNRSDHADQ